MPPEILIGLGVISIFVILLDLSSLAKQPNRRYLELADAVQYADKGNAVHDLLKRKKEELEALAAEGRLTDVMRDEYNGAIAVLNETFPGDDFDLLLFK